MDEPRSYLLGEMPKMPLPEVAQFEMLARLVQSVPAYQLELGTDLETIPRAIEPILAAA